MLEIAQEWMALRVWLSEEGAGATVHKAVSDRHYRQQRGYALESHGLLSREEPISRSVDSTVMMHAGYFRVGQQGRKSSDKGFGNLC